MNLLDPTARVEFSPEPVTQSRSPFSNIPTYSPSSISGTANVGSSFSTLGSISSNVGSSMGSLGSLSSLGSTSTSLPSSSGTLQLTPTLTDRQIQRLTEAAER